MNRSERRAQARKLGERKRYLLGLGYHGRTDSESAELAKLVAEWEETTRPYDRMAVEDSITNERKNNA